MVLKSVFVSVSFSENQKFSTTFKKIKLQDWKMPSNTRKGVIEDSFPRITKKFLQQVCKQNNLYMTPHLNDTLYLHFKGLMKIENLEEYTGLKSLWLENNGIRKIENLDHQTDLRCLYLQENLLSSIENLEPLQLLDSLNVNKNAITQIENLSCLPHLKTLQISHNRLCSIEDIQHLTKCRSISVLDLSNNMIDDPGVLDIFASMTSLRVLNMSGNPMLKHMKNYRKNFIFGIKELCYLDDRPVTDQERACVNAWSQGGLDAERKERIRWKEMEEDKLRRSVEAVLALRKGRSNLDILLKLEKEEDILIETVDTNKTGHDDKSVTNESSTIKDELNNSTATRPIIVPSTETTNQSECLVSTNSGHHKENCEKSQGEKRIRKPNVENQEDIPPLEDVDISEFQLHLPDDQISPEENDLINVIQSDVQEEEYTTDYQMDISFAEITFQDKENKLLISASKDDSCPSVGYCTDENDSSNMKSIPKVASDIKIEECLVQENFIPRSEMSKSLAEEKVNITDHSETESKHKYANDLNADASNGCNGKSIVDVTNKLATIASILNSLEGSENKKDVNNHESTMKECSSNNNIGDSVKGDNLKIQESPNNEKEFKVQFDDRGNLCYKAIFEELHSKETISGKSEIEFEDITSENVIARSELCKSLAEEKANITDSSETVSLNEYTNDLNEHSSNGNSLLQLNENNVPKIDFNSHVQKDNIDSTQSAEENKDLQNEETHHVFRPSEEYKEKSTVDFTNNNGDDIEDESFAENNIKNALNSFKTLPQKENFEIDASGYSSNVNTSSQLMENCVPGIDFSSHAQEDNTDSTQSIKENIDLQNEETQIVSRPSEATEECDGNSTVDFTNSKGDVLEAESFAGNNNQNALNSFETLPQKENFGVDTDASCISNSDSIDVRVDISRVQSTNYISKYPITSCVLHRIQVTEDTDEDTTSMDDFTPSSSSYNSISEESTYSIPEIKHQVPPQKIHALIDKAQAKLLSVSTCESDIDYNLIEGNRASSIYSNETSSTDANISVYQNIPDLHIESDLLRDISNTHFSLAVSNSEINTLNAEAMIQPASESSKIRKPEPAVNVSSLEESTHIEATTSAIHGILSETEQQELEEFIVQTQSSDLAIPNPVGASSYTMPETETLLSEILLREYENLTDEEKQNKFSHNEKSLTLTTRQESHPPLEEINDEDVENDIWSILEKLTNHKDAPGPEQYTEIELEERNSVFDYCDIDFSIASGTKKSKDNALLHIDNHPKDVIKLDQETRMEPEEGYIDYDKNEVSDVNISTTFGLSKSEYNYMDKKQKDASKPYQDTKFEPKGCINFDYFKNPDANILKKFEVNKTEDDSLKNIEKERSLSFLEVTNDFFEPQIFNTEHFGFDRNDKIKSKPNTEQTKRSDHSTEDEVWLRGCSNTNRNKLQSKFDFEQLNIETKDSLTPKSKLTTKGKIGGYVDNSEEECIIIRSNNRDSIFGGQSTYTRNRTFPKMCCLDLQATNKSEEEMLSAKDRIQEKKNEPLFKRRYLQENVPKSEEQHVLIEELD
ncbi:hypothetical protein JTE90_024807 [Oedothorax gibbosus]|uniref:Dynein axonemal assembly factor 1 homolog n=1 Tax=Oedothorax gibbosus TaxID=931172 RepID=A0AAV6UNM2_9ARAC|nr:hypothetical protein JTE90_024807 [Oedothorax gibbosus]